MGLLKQAYIDWYEENPVRLNDIRMTYSFEIKCRSHKLGVIRLTKTR